MHRTDDDDRFRAKHGASSDAELIAALRRVDSFAIEELIRRFQPGLLAQARRARIAEADRHTWVLEVLHDVALRLTRADGIAAQPLAAYVARALRNKVAMEFREAARRAQRNSQAERLLDSSDERAVSESVSVYSIRASRGPEFETPTVSPVLKRLAAALDEGLTAEERQVLNWASAFVPHRVIADWLGINRDAVSQRLSRLTRRLRDVARRFGEGELDDDERAVLRRFFRRVLVAHGRGTEGKGTDEEQDDE